MTDHERVTTGGTPVEIVQSAEIAHIFLTALARRNFQQLETSFQPDIHFRALVPLGLRTGVSSQETAGWFSKWFSQADHFEVVQSEIDHIADRLRIAYRIRLHDRQGWHVVEQQVYCTLKNERIEAMDLLCSGFRPEAN